MSRLKQASVLMLLAVIGLGLGMASSHYLRQPAKISADAFHGTWLDKPREVSQFDLQDTGNAQFNQASLENHWTMMFFGFTTCPSICPTTMTELSKMVQILKERGVQTLPQVVLVSLDPQRDTLKKLRNYVTAFNPDFVGVRGRTEDEVKALAQEMGVAYTKVAVTDPQNLENYNIEHTGTVMLFNPQGQLTAFFTMPHQAAWLADDFQMALKATPSRATNHI